MRANKRPSAVMILFLALAAALAFCGCAYFNAQNNGYRCAECSPGYCCQCGGGTPMCAASAAECANMCGTGPMR